MPESSSDSSFAHVASGAALARYMRFVRRTSRVVSEPADIKARLNELHPFIFAMWHGQFMMLPTINTARIPTRIMVARHGDAEVLGQALLRFDMGLIRGAGAGARSRDRGGAQALRAAVKALAEGTTVAMTADVPPGPARKAGLGIVTLARLSGRPIVPAAMATTRYRSLDTWSRFTINLPFSTLGIVLGEPILVPRDAPAEALDHYREVVEQAMNRATARAYELAGADPSRSLPRGSRVQRKAPDEGIAGGAMSGASVSARMAPPPPPGIVLGAYRAVTSVLAPVAPLILHMRTRQGKEDRGRRGERYGRSSRPRPPGPLVWLHAASVGETNAVLPLMEALGRERPDATLLLTTGTVTSAGVAAQRLPEGVIHQYVPLDARRFVTRFLDHWRPDVAVLTESEIWPNLILETSARRVPIVLVNARMSKRSHRKWRGRPGLSRPLFGRFELVLAQNERLAERFAELGAPNVLAVGNLKIDAPPPPIDGARLAALKSACGVRPLLLATSTHEGEEVVVAEAHRALARELEGLLTIIAPRHPERGPALAEALRALGFRIRQRSLGELPEPVTDIYLADTLGELGTLYALAPIAFVGGSLVDKGGQNPIEAVRHGAAVLTGPNWYNFKDAYGALIKSRGAIEVRSGEDIVAAVRQLALDASRLAAQKARAAEALNGLSGALGRTLSALLPFVPGRTDVPVEVATAGEELKRAS